MLLSSTKKPNMHLSFSNGSSVVKGAALVASAVAVLYCWRSYAAKLRILRGSCKKARLRSLQHVHELHLTNLKLQHKEFWVRIFCQRTPGTFLVLTDAWSILPINNELLSSKCFVEGESVVLRLCFSRPGTFGMLRCQLWIQDDSLTPSSNHAIS
jgi:hypothetical protein